MFPILRGILDTFPVHVDDAAVIFVQDLDIHIKIDLEPFFCGLLQPSSEVLKLYLEFCWCLLEQLSRRLGMFSVINFRIWKTIMLENSHEVVNVTDINNYKDEIPDYLL